jgi:hypothetical protein
MGLFTNIQVIITKVDGTTWQRCKALKKRLGEEKNNISLDEKRGNKRG